MIRTSEEWAPIKGYEGVYEVSNLGGVASVRSGNRKILKPSKPTGYLQIVLSINNSKRTHRVHRLVAEAFIPNPKSLPEVNHIDEDKLNNCVDNLEWCTRKYNVTYGTGMVRSISNRSKEVVAFDQLGNIVHRFKSTKEAGRNGFSQGHISSCCLGNRKTHRGLYWKYTETLEESI